VKKKSLISASLFGAAFIVASPSFGDAATVETCAKLETHNVSVTLSEPMMRIDGAYHELIDSLYLKPVMKDKQLLAPLTDIIDELNGVTKVADKTVIFELAGRSVTMTVGSPTATVDGKEAKAPIAPEIIEEQIYVPVRFVLEGLGGVWSWDAARERASIDVGVPPGSILNIPNGPINLGTALTQKEDWYGSDDAKKAADGVLANQNPDGGWFKLSGGNNFAFVVDRDKFPTYRQKSTIDNDTTMVQIRFLGRVFKATNDKKYGDAVVKGVEYILKTQYDNGGWPQFAPITTGYHQRVTFNDDAVANVAEVLIDVGNKAAEFGTVSDDLSKRAKAAVDKSLALVLKTQVVENGKKTAWCAQYNEKTLTCDKGRSYELASISGSESVNLIRFLMGVEKPSKEIVDAVNSAVAFLDSLKITGKKIVEKKDATLEFGFNRVLVDDPAGAPLWPRFIELGTHKALFSNRGGDKLYTYEDVSYERRNKYSWLVGTPQSLLEKDYPAWQKKHSPDVNALAR